MTRKEIYQALAEGKQMQVKDSLCSWVDQRESDLLYYLATHLSDCLDCVRIKPAPKRVPLGPADITPGTVIRNKQWEHRWSWVMVKPYEGGVGNMSSGLNTPGWGWHGLMDEDYEYSNDLGKTWKPCWKEESCDT